MQIQILNQDGKLEGHAEIPASWKESSRPNPTLLHEVTRAYLANQREGTHSALTRAEVSGGGKKPWKQKHTGRARAGTSRSPLWRGGGIIHGPKPRSYRIDLPKAKIRNALKQALIVKLENGDLFISSKPDLQEAKTKNISQWLKKLSLPQKVLLILDKKDEKIAIASKNLSEFSWMEWNHIHPYHILSARKIVLTPEALQCL